MELALKVNAEELIFRPNTLRYRGALRLKVGQNEWAEADFLDAIALDGREGMGAARSDEPALARSGPTRARP